MFTTDDDAQVKGHAYLSYIVPLRERPLLWARAIELMPAADCAFFEGEIFANQWYPRAHLHALLDALERAKPGDVQVFRDVGAWSARHQIGTVYRAFLAFASPALVFRRAESVLGRQTTRGTFRVIEDAEDHLVGELVDPHLPRRMPHVIAGWSDEVIRMLRRTPVPTAVTATAPGRWRFLVSWAKS